MAGKISPSLMCVDFMRLEENLALFESERESIEYLHMDVMDGVFVPNFTLGTDFVKAVKAVCKIPIDLHLMILEPEKKLASFGIGEGDIVSVHYESTPHIHRALQEIKALGARAAVALNPGTPLGAVDELLPDIDCVLIMSVNPGFAGQNLIRSALGKIKRLKAQLVKSGFDNIEIEVDGNVSFENARIMRQAGADIFVAGTSSVFSCANSLSENIKFLRAAIV